MSIVVLDVGVAPEKLKGVLSRRLLEIRSGLFIGALSKRATEQLWEWVVAEKLDAAFLAFPAKNELGWSIITSRKHQYCVDDNYGLPLMKFTKKVGVKAKIS